MTKPVPTPFSGYQKVVVAMLAFLQFAVILDFMLMSPLGAVIMPALNIGPKQFGLVVSAYAFSAGASGLLTAGFADRFDRKKLLLFFYTGFILGTLWCGLATSFESLLAARIVTGLFGGVIGSVVLAIATDLFAPQQRGRVMGLIQTAFAASQVLGIPAGIYLSSKWNWHIPFVAMAAFGLTGGLLVAWKLQPVNGHLGKPQEHSAWMHLFHTVTERRYLLAFATTALLTTGGFMLMPFSSAYVVNNLGIDLQHLPTVYLVTGLCTIFVGPMVGKAADAVGKFRVFLFGTALTITMVLVYTHLGATSLVVLIIVNTVLFIGIFSRMIPFQAMMASVPAQTQRGSFNAISASIQQLSGGLASVVAGHIVTQSATGRLQNFDVVGFVVVGTSLIGLALLWRLNRNTLAAPAPQAAA
ncbi:MFS transporter [Rugamonas aquatica]|uniref:MFS transporter n=1 Tax=Rugamonas aquatica TaxID=2743357 RepID=A0A6A7N1J9_9BURK|nr:MFS transporter [Rugamonas aquatica]MQA38913.1 MFS transporter [Rugamonas aquatica]